MTVENHDLDESEPKFACPYPCPNCHEDDIDELSINEDDVVTCLHCGTTYQI